MRDTGDQIMIRRTRTARTEEIDLGAPFGVAPEPRTPARETGRLRIAVERLRRFLPGSVGDLVVTERSASSNVVLCVENEKRFLANIGQFKGNRALKVLRAVQEGDRV